MTRPKRSVEQLGSEILDRLLTQEWDYLGRSVSRVVGLRTRALAQFAGNELVHGRKARPRIVRLRQRAGAYRGHGALVIALGPSLRKLDLPSALGWRERGDVILAINGYDRTELAPVLPPTHYVLADPAYFVQVDCMPLTHRATWDYVRGTPGMTVVLPAHRDPPIDLPDSDVLYFNGFGLEGWTRSIDPTRPRGYLGMTAYIAIALAGYFECDPIRIIGVDNTLYQNARLDPLNRPVLMGKHHAYDEDGVFPLPQYRHGVAALFQDTARLFADLHMFSHLPVINLDPDTLVDAFPRAGSNYHH
jgi:hypothetical protein